MMRRSLLTALGGGALYLMLGLFAPATSNGEVNVSVNIPLPGLVIPAPPPLVVIPGTYVYYPPDVSVDIFFYHGYWYRPYGGGWYISNGYNGPWRGIGPERVPHALINVPPAYRRIPPEHERMPHNTVQRNWRTWEKERHWDKPGGEHGHGGEHGRGHGHGG